LPPPADASYTARDMSRPAVIDFYDRHPIDESQVLAALQRRGKDPARLVPEDLYELYSFFVGLVETGKLGGARFSASAAPRAS
jgi:hypothetical protein